MYRVSRDNKKQIIPAKSIVFLNFSLGYPLRNNENKSCLNELKFWEASENHKSRVCWTFQLSISCGTQKSVKIPLPVAKMIWSFCGLLRIYELYKLCIFFLRNTICRKEELKLKGLAQLGHGLGHLGRFLVFTWNRL